MLDYQRVAGILLFPFYLHKNPKVTTSAPSFLFVQSPKEYNKHPKKKKSTVQMFDKWLFSKKNLDLPSEKKYVMWFDWSFQRYGREAGKREAGWDTGGFGRKNMNISTHVRWNWTQQLSISDRRFWTFLIQHAVDGSEIRLTSWGW